MKLNINLQGNSGRKSTKSIVLLDNNDSNKSGGITLPQVLDSSRGVMLHQNEYIDGFRSEPPFANNSGHTGAQIRQNLAQNIRQRQINISKLSNNSKNMEK